MKNKVIQMLTSMICKHDWVDKIILFGSRARGDAEPRADIDLAVLCPRASEEEWTYLWHALDEAETLLKIDLVRYDQAAEELKKSIMKEGVVLYERGKSQAIDTQP